MSQDSVARFERGRRARALFFLAVAAGLVLSFASAALLISIFERKQEAKNPFYRVVELTDDTDDPELWGKNFPFHYDGYRRTVDQVRTRFGGSEALPRTPTDADPRSVVAQSKLEEDPRLKKLWAGYAFALDFREERGHAFMLEDQSFTGRHAVPQPGACLNCHASAYLALKKLGDGDLERGFERLNPMPYKEASAYVSRAVACIDCHDPRTMQLRITRPAFARAIRALKEKDGVRGYDVNSMATRQEMRSYVCAQCHVEYYFQGPERRLVFPWAKGLRADEILAYYDEARLKDWVHAESGAEVLKAQHPEFELWSQGIHARSGVACADCHMPYRRVGAMKISDHHVRSPLLAVDRACQTCHRFSEGELVERVERIQTTVFEVRGLAMDATIELIEGIRSAKEAGAADESLAAARSFQRQAQFFLDFVEAENSTGFHAPEEALRVLALSIDAARRGIAALGAKR